jgi:hypothetical protein
MKTSERFARPPTILIAGVAALSLTVGVAKPRLAFGESFFFNTGTPDGRLGALSQRPSTGNLETETADDFILTQSTIITGATITGLIPAGAPLSSITNVEVELYHVFPRDSVQPPSGNVPSRMNSPADIEIDDATRDGSLGTLSFEASLDSADFSVANTVATGINKKPHNVTEGEGRASGQEVEIDINFTPPIILPADHYFFRPEALLSDGNFLYLSAPRPIVSPGTPFVGDLQAWIRNSDLAPDWLRIGTDIIGGATPPTFNMTFSLVGATLPNAKPGRPNCHGKSVSELAEQFQGLDTAASSLGFSSVDALQDALKAFCEE